jgi:single-stranded-DNA-specific exonuclease
MRLEFQKSGMMQNMQWVLKSSQVPRSQKELLQMLLENRGLHTKKDKESFLAPQSPLEFSPKDVGIDASAMKRAVKLVQEAKEKKWKVLVFGDYDCDGICATTILWETLYEMGVHAMPFIPSRDKHGYGLSMAALDDILADPTNRPQLLITVDNGIVAHEAFTRLQKEGVKTILTDHHQPEKTIPPVDVLVHTTQLCGTTVSWMFAHALNPEKAGTMLDLCAIATIADQVPLLFANRSFAKHGIEALKKTKRVGLQMLIQAANVDPKTIDAKTVNYMLAPRINAMGRIGEAMNALRLLCSKKMEKAISYASQLQSTNIDRQSMTIGMIELARQRKDEWKDQSIIVIESDTFHEGVIGLVASKLVEEFGKPAVVIAKGKGRSKGSARSVPGVNITELLRDVREHLLDIGGHPMAAGFSLAEEQIQGFMQQLYIRAKEVIDTTLLQKRIEVELELPWKFVNMETYQTIEQLQPFGSGNPKPLFVVKGANIVQVREFGKEKQYMKYYVADPTNAQNIIETLSFLQTDKNQIREGDHLDLIISFDLNEWNGKKSLQFRLISAKTS